MVDQGTPLARRRAVLLAFLIACAVVWLLGAIPRWGLWYAPQPYDRAQAHALLQGRLALSHDPGGLALDLAWVDGGVQQVWGLGVPLWLALWELVGRAIHLTPFPDRIALLFGAAVMFYALLRAWLGPGGDRSAASRGAFLFTALAPAVVTMLRGYIGVYEEAAAYAYGAAMLLLAGVLTMIRRPATGRYVVLVAFAGATGLVRPTVWFYGAAAAVVSTVLYVRHRGSLRRAWAPVALAASLFVAGGGALYLSNAARFGRGGEFGHRLNLEDMPGNLHATRFDYPFRTAPWTVAARELAGAMFGRPELAQHREYYDRGIHAGQAAIPRLREYYFTTYTWPYALLALAGLAGAGIAWSRARRPARSAAESTAWPVRDGPDLDRDARWLGAWAVLGAAPLVVFYLHSPSLSSRYLIDLAPAIAVLLVIAWRYAAAWLAVRRLAGVAFAGLAVWWAVSALGFRVRRAWQPPVGATAATATMRRFTEPWPAVPLVPPGAYDRADPWLDLYLVGEWRCRCYADLSGEAACDHRDLPAGSDVERFPADRPRLVEHRAAPAAPVCVAAAPADGCPLGDAGPQPPALGDDAGPAALDARSAPPVLYGNGTHWDLDTGRVGVATYLFVDDPAYVEVEVSRVEGAPAPGVLPQVGPAAVPQVRARVALEELPLRAMASTARGVLLRFAGPATPRYRRGLQVVFLAFGPPARLDEPVSDYVLWRVAWRERREGER